MTYIPYDEKEVINGHIIFKQIVQDETPENPLVDCDAMGSIFSFGNRHGNFITREQFEEYTEQYGVDLVLLSYFEHGSCIWGVQGTLSNTPDFRWDGVDAAGIWIPDKCLLDEAKNMKGKERREKMELWAEQACTVYTQWCNGEVYGVCVKAYKAKYHDESGELYDDENDYRFEEEVYDNCCFGHFGYQYAEEALAEALTSVKKELEEKGKAA